MQSFKECHPVNRTASNDCLPYENSYFFRESTAALALSTAAAAVESIDALALSATASTAADLAGTLSENADAESD